MAFWRIGRTRPLEDTALEDSMEEIRRGAERLGSSGTGIPTAATRGYIYIRLGATPEIYGRENLGDDWTKVGNVS